MGRRWWPKRVLSLPTRNWNAITVREYPDPAGFWAYLRGIETGKYWFSFVLTWWSFEPTYEELKLKHASNISTNKHNVLSLPTRNWNKEVEAENEKHQFRFWAYLRGIETCFINAYLPFFWTVLSLPTRNWNLRKALGLDERAFMFWAYLRGIETVR